MSTRRQYEFERENPHPGDDPIARLRHTLDMYYDQPDDEFALTATLNMYPDGGTTGLTWGDLRAIADRLSPPQTARNRLAVSADATGPSTPAQTRSDGYTINGVPLKTGVMYRNRDGRWYEVADDGTETEVGSDP